MTTCSRWHLAPCKRVVAHDHVYAVWQNGNPCALQRPGPAEHCVLFLEKINSDANTFSLLSITACRCVARGASSSVSRPRRARHLVCESRGRSNLHAAAGTSRAEGLCATASGRRGRRAAKADTAAALCAENARGGVGGRLWRRVHAVAHDEEGAVGETLGEGGRAEQRGLVPLEAAELLGRERYLAGVEGEGGRCE